MRVLVVYATREGQTRRVAEHVRGLIERDGSIVDLRDVSDLPESFDMVPYDAAVLAASVHLGRHEKEMTRFVRAHRAALERIPAAFLSISLSEATVEDETRPEAMRKQAKADVERMLLDFFEATGWRPRYVKPVAGALLYQQYGWFLRLVMKRIARRAGGPTDMSRDYEMTDWEALDRFVEGFVAHQSVTA